MHLRSLSSMAMKKSPHTPVLVTEFLSFFDGKTIKRFVDATVGFGGHATEILNAHPEITELIGIDQDDEALTFAKEKLAPFADKVSLRKGNFRNLSQLVTGSFDGIFVDLGVSSLQLDKSERGFSFMREGPLDMRMDRNQELTAYDIINTYSEQDIEKILFEYGEEPRAKKVAQTIVQARKRKPIETTLDLVKALEPLFPRRGKLHPMTLIFQGLRIAVNDELGAIESFLPQALSLLKPQGRLGVLAFHSLEDRIVKETFKTFAKEDRVELLTKKVVLATREESKRNPRSRSARLRFIEKVL